MNFQDIKDQIKAQGRLTSTDLDSLISFEVNRTYRQYARMHLWPQLVVDLESITTLNGVSAYWLPYPFERFVTGSSYYDVTSTDPGNLIAVSDPRTKQRYRGLAGGATPYSMQISSGTGADLYNTGTVIVANRGTTVTGSGTTWTTPLHAGQWIRFGVDASSNSGGDYGYKIASVTNTTTIVLSTAYRGPDLATANYAIRPGNTLRVQFDPVFTDFNKAIKYSWYQKPARLYNPEDVPEIQDLSDAMVFQTLASNEEFHKGNFAYFAATARDCYRQAFKTIV